MLNKGNYLPAIQNGTMSYETSRQRRERTAREAQDRRERVARAAAERAAAGRMVDEARLTALQAELAAALTKQVIDYAEDIEMHRRNVARDDLALNIITADLEAEGITQIKRIQRSLFNPMDI